MLRTLGLALLALLRAVGPGQASGFTGEGSRLGEGDAGGVGGPWEWASRMGTVALLRAGQASALRADTPKEVECVP